MYPYIPQVLPSFTHLNATWWACFGILCVPSMTLVMILVKMVIKYFVFSLFADHYVFAGCRQVIILSLASTVVADSPGT